MRAGDDPLSVLIGFLLGALYGAGFIHLLDLWRLGHI